MVTWHPFDSVILNFHCSSPAHSTHLHLSLTRSHLQQSSPVFRLHTHPVPNCSFPWKTFKHSSAWIPLYWTSLSPTCLFCLSPGKSFQSSVHDHPVFFCLISGYRPGLSLTCLLRLSPSELVQFLAFDHMSWLCPPDFCCLSETLPVSVPCELSACQRLCRFLLPVSYLSVRDCALL